MQKARKWFTYNEDLLVDSITTHYLLISQGIWYMAEKHTKNE